MFSAGIGVVALEETGVVEQGADWGLYEGTVADWTWANYELRIKTCGIFITAANIFSNLNVRENEAYARELEECISIAAKEAPSSMKLVEVAATCLILMENELQ